MLHMLVVVTRNFVLVAPPHLLPARYLHLRAGTSDPAMLLLSCIHTLIKFII